MKLITKQNGCKMTKEEIKKAQKENKQMVWADPLPIEGNDYTISYIEDLSKYDEFDDEEMEDIPILIQYNDGGSEAEVFITEIKLK